MLVRIKITLILSTFGIILSVQTGSSTTSDYNNKEKPGSPKAEPDGSQIDIWSYRADDVIVAETDKKYAIYKVLGQVYVRPAYLADGKEVHSTSVRKNPPDHEPNRIGLTYLPQRFNRDYFLELAVIDSGLTKDAAFEMARREAEFSKGKIHYRSMDSYIRMKPMMVLRVV